MGDLLFGLVAGCGLTWAFTELRRDSYWREFSTRRRGSNPPPPGRKPAPPAGPPEPTSSSDREEWDMSSKDGSRAPVKPQFPAPQIIREDFL